MKAGGNVDLNEPRLQSRIQEDVKSKEFIAGVPATSVNFFSSLFSSRVTLRNGDRVGISSSLHTLHASWGAWVSGLEMKTTTKAGVLPQLLVAFSFHYTCC